MMDESNTNGINNNTHNGIDTNPNGSEENNNSNSNIQESSPNSNNGNDGINDNDNIDVEENVIHNGTNTDIALIGDTIRYKDIPQNRTGIDISNDVLTSIRPYQSTSESLRDCILFMLDNKFFTILNLIVILLVVADGAFFFFLIIGAHRMCTFPSKTDCNPRNYWLNWSIQLLNVLFTYMVSVSMPWRMVQFFHTTGCCTCPKRTNAIGYNVYGVPCTDIWFYIPIGKRCCIIIILLLNAIFQYINQITRIIFYSFDLQNSSPGNIWTNVFFASSFLCAFIGSMWMLYEFYLIRSEPGGYDKFGPGPIETIKHAIRQFITNIFFLCSATNAVTSE